MVIATGWGIGDKAARVYTAYSLHFSCLEVLELEYASICCCLHEIKILASGKRCYYNNFQVNRRLLH